MNATTRYLDRAARQCLNVSTVRAAYANCSSRSQRRYMAILLRAVRADVQTQRGNRVSSQRPKL